MIRSMTRNGIALFLAVLVLATGCSWHPSPKTGQFIVQVEGGQPVMTGVASWYGQEFHGRRTANGEIYDMFKLTAAHRTLPFNSLLEVENLENHRKTLVRINDRGPFIQGRIIDLSLKAAKMLDMEEGGTARVALRFMQADEVSRDRVDYQSGQGYWLQAGAFSRQENALMLRQKLNEAFVALRFEIRFQNGYYRVVSARIPSRPEAEKWLRQLNARGIDGFIKEFE